MCGVLFVFNKESNREGAETAFPRKFHVCFPSEEMREVLEPGPWLRSWLLGLSRRLETRAGTLWGWDRMEGGVTVRELYGEREKDFAACSEWKTFRRRIVV